MNTTLHKLNGKTMLLALASALTASGVVVAKPSHKQEHWDSFQDSAWVVARTPVYEDVNSPRRECWVEQVGHDYAPPPRSYAGAVIGGVVGGIVGSQVGKGTGKTVATAVGAATGAIVGDRIDNRDAALAAGYGQPRYEERCRTVDNWERRLTGYTVTYRYAGRDYVTFLPYDPGNSVRVRVNVSLAQ